MADVAVTLDLDDEGTVAEAVEEVGGGAAGEALGMDRILTANTAKKRTHSPVVPPCQP